MNNFIFKISIIFLIVVFGFSSFSICDDYIEDDNPNTEKEIIESATTPTEEIKIPNTNSRACVIIDRNTNAVLYGKNENQKRKMASTTKIMTATIIIENCNLNETVEISKKAAGTGGSRLGLKAGDKITIRDLLYGLMMRSGNDSAVALAEYAGGSIEGFAEKMNQKASDLGLNNTHFETPHGLDSDEHYTTAYELALLSNYALNNKIFAQIVGTKEYTITINGYPKQLSNTNELLGNLDGVYGIKTGFTNGANRCLVTACKRNNMDIICVVLGADTKNFRTQDSVKLINYIFDNFKPVNIEKIVNDNFEKWKNNYLDKIIINKSYSKKFDLRIDNITNNIMPIRKDYIDLINVDINCPLYFEAPIYKNFKLGSINLHISDTINFEYPIYNSYEVKRKNWNNYFIDFFKDYSSTLNNLLL